MKYLIMPTTLKSLRARKRLTQQALADRCAERGQRVGLATIKRIESFAEGECYGASKTVAERLAKVLGVTVEELAREPRETAEADVTHRIRWRGFDGRQIRTTVPPYAATSFDMVEERYGIPVRAQVAMAPLFTALLAEASLQWRRERLAKTKEHAEALNNLAGANFAFLHAAGVYIDEGLFGEADSINKRDVFGRDVGNDTYDSGYDPDEENAFSFFLRDFVSKFPDADIELEDGVDLYDFPRFRVAARQIRELTGGNLEAEYALTAGHVRIDDIPEDLRAEEQAAARAEWLISRIPEQELRDLRASLEEHGASTKFARAMWSLSQMSDQERRDLLASLQESYGSQDTGGNTDKGEEDNDS